MNKWERLRTELLKSLYEMYMESHTAWAEFGSTDEFSLSDVTREADYLCEKGWVRRSGGYQLTAEGRDHVERNIVGVTSKPSVNVIK